MDSLLPKAPAAIGCTVDHCQQNNLFATVPSPPGEIHIHCYPDRCFPTSIVAAALRSAAQGINVMFAQLLANGPEQGPDLPIHLGPCFFWVRPALTRTVEHSMLGETERRAVVAMWQYLLVRSGTFDLIVLDEIGLAIHLGLLCEQDVARFLITRPPHQDVVLCGSAIPASFERLASHWTESRSSEYSEELRL
ncbi:cob(I)yrinic acid a,c-diamide adenosyltransferase [Gloeobacter morelensis]|uniref:cob(I)yrinic acid a,c-diamide adenosyltransferase n=1 Tax=Gloeobacter morelensis TaxID=2907343 RepID=UPI001E35385A|nr:cob(I)yrinic acid a,c-diamide adenosyltransferase [Gloeobacter morelensis]UFP97157.1 cob(I)yrinic acid a,c-diamide adenosyltransferase [Gloeobacter morelensis MG652769]